MAEHPSSPGRVSAARAVVLLCLAEVLSMTAFAAFPALVPLLVRVWDLRNSQAGLASGMLLGGYMAAVPVLTSLTDRLDARRVYLLATTLSALGALGFATLARGFWSALAFQAVAGAGLAGTYMPGLKLLAEYVAGPRQSRMVAFYTSTFGIGMSLSLYLAGTIASTLGWRFAFGLAAIGPLAAGVLVVAVFPARRPRPAAGPRYRLLDFRPVVRNREATGYILSYAAHCWELFGFRSWIVAFFAFAAGRRPGGAASVWSAATLAAIVNLLGPVASILGNEMAEHFGRRRVVVWIMGSSVVLACVVGYGGALPGWAVFAVMTLYFLVIMGDSATLTAGVVSASTPERRGATMALHSFLGFGAGFVGPAVFGAVLDLTGGNSEPLAWGLAFASLALGYLLAPLPLLLLRARA